MPCLLKKGFSAVDFSSMPSPDPSFSERYCYNSRYTVSSEYCRNFLLSVKGTQHFRLGLMQDSRRWNSTGEVRRESRGKRTSIAAIARPTSPAVSTEKVSRQYSR